MTLTDKLLKASTLQNVSTLSDSTVFNTRDFVQTPIPGLNIAYSGSPNGGLTSDVHIFAGPSKHFKTMYALLSAAAYLKKYSDGVLIFYDNEFGSPIEYFESVGIDPNRVIHKPFTTLEDLRTDITNTMEALSRDDNAIIIIDSLGMAASKKEYQDALDGSEKSDMTRAKIIKSIFRILTPHIRLKNIPLIAIQHTYEEMSIHPKQVIAGGTGQYYAASNIYIIGRRQIKDPGKDLEGYNFIIRVEKSRYVKEKSQIPISVKTHGGIMKYSGLLDIALLTGFAIRKGKFYNICDKVTGEVLFENKYRKDIENSEEIWATMLNNQNFVDCIEHLYKVSQGSIIENGDEQEITDQEILSDDKPATFDENNVDFVGGDEDSNNDE